MTKPTVETILEDLGSARTVFHYFESIGSKDPLHAKRIARSLSAAIEMIEAGRAEPVVKAVERVLDEEVIPVPGNEAVEKIALAAGIAAFIANEVPKGWKLVPEEPTEDMLIFGQEAWAHRPLNQPIEDCKEAELIWRAMLAAAPEPKEEG